METTLNKIREHSPCEGSWRKLLSGLSKTKADDEPLKLITILEILDIWDAVWCLRTLEYRDYCLFLADVVEPVLHVYEKLAADQAPRNAIKAIDRWRNGEISRIELQAAAYAAYDAADAADADAAAYAARREQWQKTEQLFIKHFGS